jgi:HK97 family phage major capsid protein
VYDDVCPHGYLGHSCAECRRADQQVPAVPDDAGSAVLVDQYMTQHRGKPKAELVARRSEVVTRAAQLEAVSTRAESRGLSQAQRDECKELAAEQFTLDELIMDADISARAATISRAMDLMKDPANLEGPGAGSHALAGGAPALVKGLGDGRRETAAEISRRAGNPWAAVRSDPLAGHTSYRVDSDAGMISRAHQAIEAMEGTYTRDACERLAAAMAEETSWPGLTMKRSKQEQADAAELWLSLSDPNYAEAFRSVLRYPSEFMGSGGVGFETLTDDQRNAWRRVRTNEACRAAFAETSGAVGAFAIPLDLHPDIILTNAGSANPFRKLARTVISTTNVAEFVTSAGSTANWVPEATGVTDTTPTLGQLAVTHYRESVWIFGSFEILQDSALGTQVPALIADAKDRLEVVAFTTGTGSAQPFGVITHGTSDATVGALTAAMVYGLHNALPPRFRANDNARPVWLANVAIMNALRQIPAFTGAVNPIMNDNQPDSIPEMLSLDVYEDSAMDASNVVSGHKNLALLDMQSFVITQRQPELLLYEPLVKATATGFPTGQAGWFSVSRTGSDLTTATACQFHTT